MRLAAARAARRRGSSKMSLPPFAQSASSSASGARVVLPAPGGATTTRLHDAASAARIAGSTSSIGSAERSCSIGGARFKVPNSIARRTLRTSVKGSRRCVGRPGNKKAPPLREGQKIRSRMVNLRRLLNRRELPLLRPGARRSAEGPGLGRLRWPRRTGRGLAGGAVLQHVIEREAHGDGGVFVDAFAPRLRQVALQQLHVRDAVDDALAAVLLQFVVEIGGHFRRRHAAQRAKILAAIGAPAFRRAGVRRR